MGKTKSNQEGHGTWRVTAYQRFLLNLERGDGTHWRQEICNEQLRTLT